ncbi:unnamed protein product [Soboliphyme baturini]|uniref:Autophagy-related protein 9 n=1 Tax=Soboliphyme baturini TaxID=241478 RepID=A0A183IZC8_9BILA|nr:unnamed protein product [Soboliphyme baturini]
MSDYRKLEEFPLVQRDGPSDAAASQRSAEFDATSPADNFAPDQVLVTVPDKQNQWRHIKNLDEFFSNIYEYHQKHGFVAILLSDMFELVQFFFIVSFAAFLLQCVDYAVLFDGDQMATRNNGSARVQTRVTLLDAVDRRCLRRLHPVAIRHFYRSVLNVDDAMIHNLTWYEVQKRLCDVQSVCQLCIQKSRLTSLDIYQRILRRKNYFVAMFNKQLLPPRLRVPLLGTVVFMTNGLKANLELLFFHELFSPWDNYWQLKRDYKMRERRDLLARRVSRSMLYLGIANFLLAPLIFAWQILYSIFSYVELLKRQPSALGIRRWSIYGRYYFRHFNELDHELDSRLSRAYKPASLYMQMFFSSTLEIIANNVAFVSGAIFSVLLVLSVYDESVLHVEHVLTILTVSGFVVVCCHMFIQEENVVFCPELMMKAVVAYTHYMPDRWHGRAHTNAVRNEFSQFYQYKATFILEELLSPLLNPFILIFWLRPLAADFVDFFRQFTVEVPSLVASEHQRGPGGEHADNGKVEMSLLHFMTTNPEWKPPKSAQSFLNAFQERAAKDLHSTHGEYSAINPAMASTDLTFSPLSCLYESTLSPLPLHINSQNLPLLGRGVSKSVAPHYQHGGARSVFDSMIDSQVAAGSLVTAALSTSGLTGSIVQSTGIADLCLGASDLQSSFVSPLNVDIFYLNELRGRRKRIRSYGSTVEATISNDLETEAKRWRAPDSFEEDSAVVDDR